MDFSINILCVCHSLTIYAALSKMLSDGNVRSGTYWQNSVKLHSIVFWKCFCGCDWPGQSMADDPQRNFRSAYYEKVGFRGVEEKKSLEILLKDNPLGRFHISVIMQEICLFKHGLHAWWNWLRDSIVWKVVTLVISHHFVVAFWWMDGYHFLSCYQCLHPVTDLEKLSTFSQRFPLPSMYRIHVWKVLLGKTQTFLFLLHLWTLHRLKSVSWTLTLTKKHVNNQM